MKRFGVDVSVWQKGFDFKKAIAEGVEFAIIKCSQADYKDSQFENHYKAAREVGIGIGAYHFCTATTVEAAREEAKTCLSAIKGKQFEYPIFIDFESSKYVNYKKLGKDLCTKIIQAFCNELEAAGYWAGFYTNYDFYLNVVHGKRLAKRYSFWLATWSKAAPVDCQMWQFGGESNQIRQNTVAGVVCDQNYAYVDYPTLIKKKRLNGFLKPVATTFKVGDKVRMTDGATVYGTKRKFSPFVYESTLYVRQIIGSRVVVSTQKTGALTGAVDKKFLTHA